MSVNQSKIDQEIQAILAAVRDIDNMASIDEINAKLQLNIPRRTLQRRLSKLVADGELVSQGEKRGRRYLLAHRSTIAKELPEVDTYIPISKSGEVIKDYARQSLTKRKPIGYQRQFLDDYIPNQSFYLSDAVKQHLHQLNKNNDGDRPAGTFARNIYNRLLVDLSWNSSRLEGNTYSLLETEKLINLGEVVAGKDKIETKMILNHKAAIEFLINGVDYIGFNRYTILNLHALLSDELLGDPDASGRLRNIAVGIGSSTYLPLEIPQLIDECFNQILAKASAIADPFEQSFFAMVHLPYLQAFEDVNKRVSRLAANIPLIVGNLSPVSFYEVPHRAYIDGIIGVYELNKTDLLEDVYVWAYERSCYRYGAVRQSLVEPDPFRLKYSKLVSDLVRRIVLEQQNKISAFALIRQVAAQSILADDKVRFIEMAESEITRLHEGNIARHKLNPEDFDAWQKIWQQG